MIEKEPIMNKTKMNDIEIKEKIRKKLEIIYEDFIKRKDRLFFEIIMFSSIKELTESFLILINFHNNHL